jgi:hypothetical protein
MKRPPESEADVKVLVKNWFFNRRGWRFSPIQNGMGEHGIHDSVGGIPVIVTPAMVGKLVNLAVTIEAKRPGRRGEKDRGMSKHQVLFMERVREAGGLSIVCDGAEDLEQLDHQIEVLRSTHC